MDGRKLILKIGLDIDKTLDQTKTRTRIYNYKDLIERFIVYKSASGTGLHFELYLRRPVTIGESFKIRENLGDDPIRLMFSKADFYRGWDFDILFTYKKINGEWKRRTFIEEVLIQ